jgi:coenzyme F420-reducing hydrogenase beta subunit
MIQVYDKNNDCCGCTACKNICPTQAIIMKPDEEGFLYPQINQDLCIDCGLCRKVCAFQNGYNTDHILEKQQVYAIKHKSDEVRKNSTSGGAFTAISDYILKKNGVIYGAAFDDEFCVVHQRVETVDGRNKMRGSKYVQSDLNDVYLQIKEDLKNGRNVLFTGVGCQVAGLNSYLEKSKVNVEKLLTVDIICHGVPSPKLFSDYISYLEVKNKSKIKQYHFRSKIKGWGHTEYTVFENGKQDHTSILSQTYKELFYSNLSLRPSCYTCKYTNFLRPADITIADYWGIENYFPEFKDELGVSAIIINTAKGTSSYSELCDSVVSIASNINDCAKRQRNLYTPSPMNPRRDEFWKEYKQYGFDYIINKYTSMSFKYRLKQGIRHMLVKLRMLDKVKRLKLNVNR